MEYKHREKQIWKYINQKTRTTLVCETLFFLELQQIMYTFIGKLMYIFK